MNNLANRVIQRIFLISFLLFNSIKLQATSDSLKLLIESIFEIEKESFSTPKKQNQIFEAYYDIVKTSQDPRVLRQFLLAHLTNQAFFYNKDQEHNIWAARRIDSILTWIEPQIQNDPESGPDSLMQIQFSRGCIHAGFSYLNSGELSLSLNWYNKALKIFKQQYDKICQDTPLILEKCIIENPGRDSFSYLWNFLYRPISDLLRRLGQFEKSILFVPDENFIQNYSADITSEIKADIFLQRSTILYFSNKPEEAIETMDLALGLEGINPEMKSSLLLSRGNYARHAGNYENAALTLEEAQQLIKTIDPEHYLYETLETDLKMFQTYLWKDVFKTDPTNPINIRLLNKALENQLFIEEKLKESQIIPGETDRVSFNFRNLAQIHFLKGNWEAGQRYLLKDIQNYLPEIKNINNLLAYKYKIIDNRLIFPLLEVAKYKFHVFQETKQQKALHQSLQFHVWVQAIEDSLRTFHFSSDTRLGLTRDAKERWDHAMKVAHVYWQETRSPEAIQLVLATLERSRSQELRTQLNQREINPPNALASALVDSLAGLQWRQNQLALEIRTLEETDRQKAVAARDALQKSIIQLNEELALADPNYHKSVYVPPTPGIDQLRKNLNRGEGMLAYYRVDSTLYCQLMTGSDYELVKRELPKDFEQNIQWMRNYLAVTGHTAEEDTQYRLIASELHDILIPNLEERNLDALVFIPDQHLQSFPFELLLEADQANYDYRDYPYLWKSYTTRYAYAPSFLIKDPTKAQAPQSHTYIGYAPEYEGKYIRTFQQARGENITPLYYNMQEVDSSLKMVQSGHEQALAFTGDEATEKAFRKYAPMASVLHLAMHAFVNDQTATQSHVRFYQSADAEQSAELDGSLHIDEIYPMDLQAELAILSACNTSVGNVLDGEGVISLARAFRFAGCENILTSLWPVEDKSSSNFIPLYLDFLAKGHGKAKALQLARQAYLGNPQLSRDFAAPSYWGQFILMGDDTPVKAFKTDRMGSWWMVLGGIFLLVFVLWGGFLVFGRR